MPDNGSFRLHTVNSLVTNNKQIAQRALTSSHRSWAPEPLAGVFREYQPKDDEGERMPPQSKRVQLHVDSSIRDLVQVVGREMDLEFAQDVGNSVAKAPVVVDGTTVLMDVPVTFLLRLDRWLIDLRTYIENLPVLDTSVTWRWDEARECYVSEPVTTFRTVKEPTVLVKWAPPTEKFTQPAQTEVVYNDIQVGTWTTVQLSGAIPAPVKRMYAARVAKLIDAVKVARETANATQIPDNLPTAGKSVLDFLFMS